MSKPTEFERRVLETLIAHISRSDVKQKLIAQLSAFSSAKRLFRGRRVHFSSKLFGLDRRKGSDRIQAKVSPLYIGDLSLSDQSRSSLTRVWIRTVDGYLNDMTIDNSISMIPEGFDHVVTGCIVQLIEGASRHNHDVAEISDAVNALMSDPEFVSESVEVRLPWQVEVLEKIALQDDQLPSDWRDLYSVTDGLVIGEMDIFELANISKEIVADRVVTWLGSTNEGTYLYFDPAIRQICICDHDSDDFQALSSTLRDALLSWKSTGSIHP